jgi:thermostable 8-oxoguanine DNA glycosylase
MKFTWHVERRDVRMVQALLKTMRHHPFVRQRTAQNLADQKRAPTRAQVWKKLVVCLLTTQQRSGPKSKVSQLAGTKPFPLSYRKCRTTPDVEALAIGVLQSFGLRRSSTIAGQVAANLAALERGAWSELMPKLALLAAGGTADVERAIANDVDKLLAGFGPKQARNLLQSLGLTRYEIPLDSRIARWLRAERFPVPVSPQALGDREYYEFILDAVQKLCEHAGTVPCVLDAAVFASFDAPDGADFDEEM